MPKPKPNYDPCHSLKHNGKDQRSFDTKKGILVCQYDQPKKQYRFLALLNNKEDKKPTKINNGFLSELSK